MAEAGTVFLGEAGTVLGASDGRGGDPSATDDWAKRSGGVVTDAEPREEKKNLA